MNAQQRTFRAADPWGPAQAPEEVRVEGGLGMGSVLGGYKASALREGQFQDPLPHGACDSRKACATGDLLRGGSRVKCYHGKAETQRHTRKLGGVGDVCSLGCAMVPGCPHRSKLTNCRIKYVQFLV